MPLTVEAERRLLAELFRLAAQRDAAEQRRQSDYDERGRRAVQEFREAQQAGTRRYHAEKETAQHEYNSLRHRAITGSDTQIAQARAALDNLERHLAREFSTAHEAIEKDFENETWETNSIFESREKGPQELVEQTDARVRDYLEHMERQVEQARQYIRLCRFRRVLNIPPPDPPDIPPTDCAAQLESALQQTSARVAGLQQMTIPALFAGAQLAAIFIPLMIVAALPVLFWFQLERLGLLAAALGGAVVVGVLLTLWLRVLARRRLTEAYAAIQSNQVAAQAAGTRLTTAIGAQAEQEHKRLLAERDRELQTATAKVERRRRELSERRDSELATARQENERIVQQATANRQEMLRGAEEKYPPLLDQIQVTYRTSLDEAQRRFDAAKTENEAQYHREWDDLTARWRSGMSQFVAELAELNRDDGGLFPDWTSDAWRQWEPARGAPGAIRFGQLTVDMQTVPGGISDQAVLNESIPAEFTLPALLDFPKEGSLLIQATGDGRDRGIDLLQSVMLRMLTTIPPGKVRFTIIDPVGLGENFAGFMHLADYDDVLITSRIWTEPGHIEQRLADLTEQMENIIQKYLRNEFTTIEEYNAQAGEVAEAFRILVIANFPANFSEAAARRLVSIMSSGARCGVYTLLMVDANQPLPPGFDLNDVAPYCTCLLWRDGDFVWRDNDFRAFPLAVDGPPGEERFTEIVRMAGESAKDSRRVEVPFEYIAPAADQLWSKSTLFGFDVPLGRAGATKLQHLRLGHGTSQHVLVAGKTGSGKSTLLHALVTNMALLYSPDEVELYLIDFKKGVEFKTYATHELAHARVVAIESEREFGLSVLQRLDGELRRRGDLFRAAGVQDLASYRQSNGSTTLPRILLVIDEFHELFVEDDKIAQDSALLLDRLVRQGRAFGIHVLLGSQTLGGAYSLARSTIGQMGVRIALQCSEADAHLILSEENTAARLLSRPGEAIYNDAGGLIEGNHPFQVVWLSDERREEYLSKVRALAARDKQHQRPRQIVFEGNVPADIRRNEILHERLSQPAWDAPPPSCTAWLGEAVAIKEPTAAVFRRENGCNLLMVGQREEAAAAMMAAILISAAGQRPPAETLAEGRGARFYVFESPRADADPSRTLTSLTSVVPHSVRVVPRREVAEAFEELAAEVDRRQADESGNYPDVFVFVSDLGRFRELRRDENDLGFSFSGEAKPPTPDKQFAQVLRDGPSVGVYTIVWCDTLGNLNRSIDRQGLREFDMRVLFQMSQNDSSYLADTPVASKLGPQLALFLNEQSGLLEKFRPYSWPAPDWLDWAARQLAGWPGLERSEAPV
jgi:S-DNA-T family DNA segregation ATPase FtsK/SpoIIIE